MMAQLLPALVYSAVLLIALLAPYAIWGKPSVPDRWIAGTIIGGAILLTGARHGVVAILSLILLLPGPKK